MEEHDWQMVVDDLKPRGYCEIQSEEEGIVIHGPVESVSIDAVDNVHIRLKWAAQMGLPGQPGFGTWVKSDDKNRDIVFPNLMVPFRVEPTSQKGQRIRFGLNIIYLDPQEESDARILAAISTTQPLSQASKTES